MSDILKRALNVVFMFIALAAFFIIPYWIGNYFHPVTCFDDAGQNQIATWGIGALNIIGWLGALLFLVVVVYYILEGPEQ